MGRRAAHGHHGPDGLHREPRHHARRASPPEWQIIGRFDIARGIYIPSPKSPATGLEVTASAARFTVPWESLREFAGSI